MQMKIEIMYQFLKATPYSVQMRENTDQKTPNTDTFHVVIINCNLTWKFVASVFIDRNMGALLIFSKICQKSISLADIFQLLKYQAFAFINVLNARKRQQSTGKFRLQKLLLLRFRYAQFSKYTWLLLNALWKITIFRCQSSSFF